MKSTRANSSHFAPDVTMSSVFYLTCVLRSVRLKFATLPPDKINSSKPQAFGWGKALWLKQRVLWKLSGHTIKNTRARERKWALVLKSCCWSDGGTWPRALTATHRVETSSFHSAATGQEAKTPIGARGSDGRWVTERGTGRGMVTPDGFR